MHAISPRASRREEHSTTISRSFSISFSRRRNASSATMVIGCDLILTIGRMTGTALWQMTRCRVASVLRDNNNNNSSNELVYDKWIN